MGETERYNCCLDQRESGTEEVTERLFAQPWDLHGKWKLQAYVKTRPVPGQDCAGWWVLREQKYKPSLPGRGSGEVLTGSCIEWWHLAWLVFVSVQWYTSEGVTVNAKSLTIIITYYYLFDKYSPVFCSE